MLKWEIREFKEISCSGNYDMKWKSITEVLQPNADTGDEKVLISFQ